jgi:acetylornithine deacetylase
VPYLLDDLELLRRLVAIDSVSRNGNRLIAEFIADYLDRPGIHLRRQLGPDDQRMNLLARVGPDTDPERRDGLVLCGHMDTVPADEPEWVSDPFTLTERDGVLAGRGTADMKGFLALAMNRLAQADRAHLQHPLGLLFTYDEELGTLGAEHYARSWPEPEWLPRSVIVGEPTSLRPVRMHKGHLKLQLTFRGTRAHSGYPHLGRNAIEPAARAIVALAELRAALERERVPASEHFPEVPFVALNVGEVHGGAAVNIVPDRCDVSVGLRILPGMTRHEVVERVRAAVARVLPDEPFEVSVSGDSPPFLLDQERPVYRLVCNEMGDHETHTVAFATDAGWLQTKGYDCVIWGPGSIAVAHKPNEAIPVAELRAGARRLERVVQRACIEGTV